MRLEQMYQEVILDHYKHPHHRGLREPFAAEVHHVNPTCGDEDVIGDGIAFAGVSRYPARVKCALLGWMAFKDALVQAIEHHEVKR